MVVVEIMGDAGDTITEEEEDEKGEDGAMALLMMRYAETQVPVISQMPVLHQVLHAF